MYVFWPYCPPIVCFFFSKSGHLFCGKQYQVMVCTVTYYYIIYIYIHKSNNVFKGREKRERFYYRAFLEFSSNILFLSPQFLRASFAAPKYPLFYTFNSLLINQGLTDLRNRTFGIHSSTFKYITLLTTKSPILQPFDI